VEAKLRLSDVFQGGLGEFTEQHPDQDPTTEFTLSSMFCYYGQHYFAFIFKPEVGQWVMFDDTTITTVGDWAAVLSKQGS
ncbi:USP domain-containing protein, partial [Haematococcus lacustris]